MRPNHAGIVEAAQYIELAGATLVTAEPQSWARVATLISEDRTRLACIYRVGPTFRVKLFLRRGDDPQWRGAWWIESGSGSIAETHADAERLACEYLKLVS